MSDENLTAAALEVFHLLRYDLKTSFLFYLPNYDKNEENSAIFLVHTKTKERQTQKRQGGNEEKEWWENKSR